MKVTRGITIDGEVVEQVGCIGGSIGVYSTETGGDDVKLYFLNKNDEVMSVLTVEAEMSQGFGFISELEMEKLL